MAGQRRCGNVRFCQNHVPLSCHGIVCSFLNHLHPALLATRLSASQLLEQKGWSVALVHASCLAVAFPLTGLSLLGQQVFIDMEVLSRREHVSYFMSRRSLSISLSPLPALLVSRLRASQLLGQDNWSEVPVSCFTLGYHLASG